MSKMLIVLMFGLVCTGFYILGAFHGYEKGALHTGMSDDMYLAVHSAAQNDGKIEYNELRKINEGNIRVAVLMYKHLEADLTNSLYRFHPLRPHHGDQIITKLLPYLRLHPEILEPEAAYTREYRNEAWYPSIISEAEKNNDQLLAEFKAEYAIE
jgi:hypothetical protein